MTIGGGGGPQPLPRLVASMRLGRRRSRALALCHRLRSSRSRAAACALGRGDRLRAMVRGRDDAALRGRVGRLERRGRGRDRLLGGRRARGARVRRRARGGRAVPLEHLHGHAAGDPRRGRPAGVRRLQPRGPVRVAATTSRPSCAEHRPKAAVLVHIGGHVAFEVRGDRRRCAPPRASSSSRTAPTPTAPSGTAGARGRGATPACTRSTRPRPCRRARAACSSRVAMTSSSSPALTATTASPTTTVAGLNFRMSEFTAALALVQTERMEEIVAAKNAHRPRAPRSGPPGRLELPDGMARASTSTSSSTRSNGRRARSTTSRATASWAPATTCPTATGSASTTGACRCTTRPERHERRSHAVRVLVTGGAGFIGSHVVDRLLAAGHEPRIFDLRPSPHHEPGEVDTVLGDLLDATALRDAMDGCDAVVHLAAAADVDDRRAASRRGRGGQRARHAQRAGGRARRGRRRASSTRSTIWVYGDRHGTVDEDTLIGLPEPPLHRDQARGRDVLPLLRELYGAGLHRSCASASPTGRARGRRR